MTQYSDLKDKMKLYFDLGTALDSNNLLKAGLSNKPYFYEVTPNTGTAGGQLVIAKVLPVGRADSPNTVLKAIGGSAQCDKVEII